MTRILTTVWGGGCTVRRWSRASIIAARARVTRDGPLMLSGWQLVGLDSDGFHSLRTDLPAKPGALKLAGGVLSWTQEGKSRSTVLN